MAATFAAKLALQTLPEGRHLAYYGGAFSDHRYSVMSFQLISSTRRGLLRRSATAVSAALLLFSASFAAAENPRVRVVTNMGEFEIELLQNLAPKTVNNFLQLVDDEFYTGLVFHRVIANFMIQGGGYNAEMQYKEPPRNVPNESRNGVKNSRGTVAMARLSDPDSADTQFYVNVKDNPHLDATGGVPGYTVFGRVAAGMETIEQIELVDTHLFAGMAAVPMQPVIIESVTRIEP